jgi:nucleoside-diphosphate-sugar epimerase
MSVLVTGGTGFIGQQIVKRLLERGEKVRLLVRKSSNLGPFAGQAIETAYGDVTDRPSVEAALAGCERLYHLANVYDWWIPDYSQYYKVNVQGTRNVLEAALLAGVEKVVYTSSVVAVPGAEEDTFSEATPHRGYFSCEYERSKFLGEQVAKELTAKGLPLVCVLPTGVYGPGDNVTISQTLKLVAGMEEVSLPPRLPYWTAPAIGFLYEMFSRFNGEAPLISRDFVRFFARPCWIDNTKARTELGLSFTPLEEGIRRHIDWLRSTGKV